MTHKPFSSPTWSVRSVAPPPMPAARGKLLEKDFENEGPVGSILITTQTCLEEDR